MLSRVITKKQRGRKYLTALAVFGLLAGTVLISTTALAVHDTGIFQLDGDASVATVPAGKLGGREDWDTICKASLYTGTATTRQLGTFCQPSPGYVLPTNSTVADRSVFIQDAGNATVDNIFKGGTDDADLNTWAWKQAKPSPPKDDLQTGGAAEYVCDQAAVTAGNCVSAYLGHKIIVFHGTRFANNGNTNIGFWFLRKPLTTATTCASTSGCPFFGANQTGTPAHTVGNCSLPVHPTPCTPGDLFVFSAFLIGGAQPNINVYEWVGPGNATNSPTNANSLQLAGGSGSNAAACDGATTSLDKFCAIVNQAAFTSPWLFQDSTSAANTIGQFEFFEGGIDLTALGFGGTCVSTFVVNTRSSGSSVNSVAQDFALGTMGSCSSSMQTTASGNDGSINNSNTAANGTASSGTDSATVTVVGAQTWGGTVDLYLCGPLGATAKCSTSGVKLGNALPVSNTNPTATSGSATLTSAGRYCWYGVFTPDTASAAAGVTGTTDDGTPKPPATSNLECFTVSPVTPSLPTQAGTSPVSFGSAVTDTATLSGAAKEPGTNGTNTTYPSIGANNGAFVGAIGFTLKGPDPNATTTNCADNATAYSGETQTFPISVNVTGNSTVGPPQIAYTASYTPGSPGKYHWVATYTYTGTAVNNNLPQTYNNDCSQGSEDVVVQQIGTTTKTVQSWVPNDSATIAAAAAGGGTLQGTIQFQLFPSNNCSGTTLYDHTFGTTLVPLTAGTDGKIHQDSANTVAIHKLDGATGGYPNVSWMVTFTPANDPSHTGSTNSCDEQSVLTITDSAP